MTLLASLYIAILDDKRWKILLKARMTTGKILVELVGIILFPCLAFLTLLIWAQTPYWYYQVASLVFLLSFALLLWKGMKDYVWILDAPYKLMLTLLELLYLRDPYTARHSKKDAEYATALGIKLGLDENELDTLEKEAMLHDIGKLGTPDCVLLKKGKFTPEERNIMERHTQLKFFMDLLPDGFPLKHWLVVGQSHHEKYDGTGYPQGLKGEAIPYHARIITLADIWDGMTSGRIYRKFGIKTEETFTDITETHKSWFDPKVLETFKRCYEETIFQKILLDDPSHQTYTEKKSEVEEVLAPPPITADRVQIEGENFFYPTSFSALMIFLKSFFTLIPFFIGTLGYFVFPSSIGLPIFFTGFLWMMEEWKLKEPINFPSWVGDAAFVAILLIFQQPEVLLIVSVMTAIRLLLYSFVNARENRLILSRFIVFLLSTPAFQWLVPRQELTSTNGILGFVAWVLVYAGIQIILLNAEAMVRGRSHQFFLRRGPFLHFMLRSGILYPLLGVSLYFFYTAKGFPFPLTYFCFLPILVLLFSVYKLRDETLHAARRVVEVWMFFLDQKLGFTQWRTINTTNLTHLLAKEMHLNPYEIDRITLAARVKDIGNIAITDSVFNAPGKLSPDDLKKIETHPHESITLLRTFPLYDDIQNMVQSHHERWDGAGYPLELKRKDIPLGSQILAVADALDAMISPRPHREARSLQEAVKEVIANSEIQFSPAVVKAMIRVYEKGQIHIKSANTLPGAGTPVPQKVPLLTQGFI